jgi:thioredoxin reductase (NADPH)
MSQVHNVAIVGSGPAGLTAAIYTARANLQPVLLEGELSSTSDQPGGQLMLTTDVENFPGFPEGVQGPDLMSSMRQQAERFGTDIRTTKVRRVDFSSRPFRLWTTGAGDEPDVVAKTVIISTGAQALMLGLESEQRLLGHGVSTCATCDGFFFRDEEIAVVGGGDSALEEANFLTRFAKKVYVIHRRDQLRASAIMQDRTFANPKIEMVWNSVVEEIHGEGSVTGISLRSTVDGSEHHLPCTGVFVAIGHRPNTELFVDQVELSPSGYVETVGKSAYTSVDGVFACGDVQDDTYRQAITAAGSGCRAAIDAERWLEANDSAEGE